MAAPIVSWYSSNNTQLLTKWEIGTVDAGTTSNEFGFLIWNNRGNNDATSIMTDCVITVKDSTGGLDGNELVTGKWVQAKVNSTGDDSFHPIGSEASGSDPDITYNPVEHSIAADSTAFGEKCSASGLTASDYASPIGGFGNSGNKDADKANYADVTLKVVVPESAPAGSIDFLTRVRYNYV